MLWRNSKEDKEARFLTGIIDCLKMLFIVLQCQRNKIGSKSLKNLIWGLLSVVH